MMTSTRSPSLTQAMNEVFAQVPERLERVPHELHSNPLHLTALYLLAVRGFVHMAPAHIAMPGFDVPDSDCDIPKSVIDYPLGTWKKNTPAMYAI